MLRSSLHDHSDACKLFKGTIRINHTTPGDANANNAN